MQDRQVAQIDTSADVISLADKPQAPKRKIQSVERALNLLELLANGETRLKSIAAALDLNESTCHHLLGTLMHRGYVAQSSRDKSYRLGNKIQELNRSAMRKFNIVEVAMNELRRLNESVGETVHLAVLQGHELTTLAVLDSHHAIGVVADPGSKTGAIHATATGKAILAWLPEREIERIIKHDGLQRFTPNTLVDEQQLLEDLRHVRRNGFAVDNEEYQNGVVCIGAAIRDHAGTVVGSFSCSLPAMRADEARLQTVQDSVRETARALSDAVGYTTGLK